MRFVCSAVISSRDARSASSSSGPAPRASVSGVACIEPCPGIAVNAPQPFAGNGAGVTAEFRDHYIIDRDAHVVNARASGPGDFPGGGDQTVAHLSRPDKGDVALRRDHALIVRVAGKGEG